MSFGNELIAESLSLPSDAISYEISRKLAELHPEASIIEGQDYYFDLTAFAQGKQCYIEENSSVHNQIFTSFDPTTGLGRSAQNALFDVRWQGHELMTLLVTMRSGMCPVTHFWIVADSREVAESFFSAVCAWDAEIRDEVLVFESGYWQKDEDLFNSIKGATFDNLILEESLKTQIKAELRGFIEARPTYEKYGVAWKRGLILVGPPGNGKTHMVKALINDFGLPCLYVKSFVGEHSTEQTCIRSVFNRARKSAPCFLVFEDLDSLITDSNRSFFLNELDGFADNSGLITIASTNHPERLDSALLERPSRFDRKYHFPLPAPTERRAYLAYWNRTLAEEARLDDPSLDSVAAETSGFSFAYLKELVLTTLLRWIDNPIPGQFGRAMLDQLPLLRSQMASPAPAPPAPTT